MLTAPTTLSKVQDVPVVWKADEGQAKGEREKENSHQVHLSTVLALQMDL